MTLADILHPGRAVHRGRVVSNIAVIVLPDSVWTDAYSPNRPGDKQPEVHCGSKQRAVCGGSLTDGLWLVGTASMCVRGDVVWCAGCWPTARYCRCGAPSGEDTVCSVCGAVGSDADKRIGAAS